MVYKGSAAERKVVSGTISAGCHAQVHKAPGLKCMTKRSHIICVHSIPHGLHRKLTYPCTLVAHKLTGMLGMGLFAAQVAGTHRMGSGRHSTSKKSSQWQKRRTACTWATDPSTAKTAQPACLGPAQMCSGAQAQWDRIRCRVWVHGSPVSSQIAQPFPVGTPLLCFVWEAGCHSSCRTNSCSSNRSCPLSCWPPKSESSDLQHHSH